jgi:cytochrome d ubiquinol oxidase subunit II
MDLNTLWFFLIAVLFVVFFLLEGFDFGVGILLPALGKDDLQRRVLLNTIGPHWDANEVWLLTAGGAMFAAFPHWYATLFSGFYLALFLLLVALVLRGVGLEFRSKQPDPAWRRTWDRCIFTGSLVASLLLGVAFANLVRGVAIDQQMQYVGGFWALLNPYALAGGGTTLLLFTLHGAVFLALKTTGEIADRTRTVARRLWVAALVALPAFAAYTYLETDILEKLGVVPGLIPMLVIAALLATGLFIRRRREGWAFAMTGLLIVAGGTTMFLTLYPRVMISTLDPAWSLTIYNASSSPYTLTVMSIVALVLVPFVLAYTVWSYWVFRRRVEARPDQLTY